MKTLQTTIPALYTKWVNTGWSMLTGRPEPAKVLTPKGAQVVADQEWEDEGGSVKPATKKPGTEPGPKIPF